ncbi:hypothetical protein F5Y14DRAFT_465308 [Nemania sp. NC0429]|nr:hypothetical protein F5Y14DRAFT_465308 [Nemania sp. NC0429]
MEDIAAVTAEAHGNLVRRYQTHGAKIKQLWSGMEPAQRTRVTKDGAPNIRVPKNPKDSSIRDYKYVSEWNLKDIAHSGPEFLLRIFEHRATKSLEEQFFHGVGDGLGDFDLVVSKLDRRETQDYSPKCLCGGLILFMDGATYGQTFQTFEKAQEALPGLKLSFDDKRCAPYRLGQPVLLRQCFVLKFLNSIVEVILDTASTTITLKQQPMKSSDAAAAAAAAISKLSIKTSTPKLDLPRLQDIALDRKALLDDDLSLLSTKPIVIAHRLKIWYNSRPQRIVDERGRRSPPAADLYTGIAFLDAIHSPIRGAAAWDYISRLLELLKDTTDKPRRDEIVQELSNACHFEYARVQAVLKRHISTDSGAKWFKRVSGVFKNGNAHIVLKDKPEVLAGPDKQLLCLFRLIQIEVTATQAVDWLTKLDEVHHSIPALRDDLCEGEIDALGDMAIIVSFIQSLSQAIRMPAFSRKRGQTFVAGATELEVELNQVKPELDLSAFAVSPGNLEEPGMADAAFQAFDDFIVEKTGTKIHLLYLDLVDDCMAKLHEQLVAQTQKGAAKKVGKEAESEYIPFPPEAPKTPEVRVQERRQKEKTRPSHSSVYKISTDQKAAAAVSPPSPSPPPRPFKVKSATAEVFSALFGRAEYRGSVPWVNFEAAFAELGFSFAHNWGSIVTFFPPEDMAIQRPLTLHRPHKSHIERHLLLAYSRRLNRAYGWGEDTFQIA